MNIFDIIKQMIYMNAHIITSCPVDEHGHYGTCSTCTTKTRCYMECITMDMMFRGEM